MVVAKSLLLVGASGRVGGLIRAAWRIRPPQKFNILAQFRRKSELNGEDIVVWDPLSERPLEVRSQAQTTMVVLAGVTPGPNAQLERNTEIALACLTAAHDIGIRRVLIASSSAVYGVGQGESFHESDVPYAPNAYGAAKLAMEAAVVSAAGDLDVCCLRIGNVLGADALLLGAANATADKPVLLDRFESGGGPVRSYIDPQTLAAVLATLADCEDNLPPILNVACPRPTAMQAIAEAAGIPWRWRVAPNNALENVVLDCTKLSELHIFRPDDSDPARMIARLIEVRST